MQANEKMLSLYLNDRFSDFGGEFDNFVELCDNQEATMDDLDALDDIWVGIKEVFAELLATRAREGKK